MSSLIVITQKVDTQDEALGFFKLWLKRIASHVDHLYVIAGSVGTHDLGGNITVVSMGRERGHGALRRYATLTYHLFRLLPSVDGVFAHMSPSFALAAWPAVLVRKPIVLWYAHVFSNTLKLRIATKMCRRVLSISPETFPFSTPKLLATGHGIDTHAFVCPVRSGGDVLNLITVNRVSPVKRLDLLIDAMSILREQFPDARAVLTIVGSAYLPSDTAHLRALQGMVTERRLEHVVKFEHGIENARVAARYCSADVVISSQKFGGLNKSTLEGMACGCIPIVPTQGSPLMDSPSDTLLMYPYGDALACARAIARVARLSPEERATLSRTARETVMSRHNLDTLALTIVKQFARR